MGWWLFSKFFTLPLLGFWDDKCTIEQNYFKMITRLFPGTRYTCWYCCTSRYVVRLSHYLQGFIHPFGGWHWDFWSIHHTKTRRPGRNHNRNTCQLWALDCMQYGVVMLRGLMLIINDSPNQKACIPRWDEWDSNMFSSYLYNINVRQM